MLSVVYGFAIFATAQVGGLLPIFFSELHENGLKLFVTFGAGLLLGMSLLHMLPEAVHLNPHGFAIWFLAGFLLLLVLERFIMVHACEETHCHYHTVGVAAFAGLAVHGLIEGFALASSILVSGLGPLVLVAILSHKAPAGFALTSILRLSGKSRKQIILFVTGVSLSGPLGMLLAHFLLQSQHVEATSGVLLSVSAGTFLYIAACDLLPELHKDDTEKSKRLISFFIGIILSLISGVFFSEHSH